MSAFWAQFLFWSFAVALSLAVAVLVVARARRSQDASAEDPGIAVHRRQLAEIDDLVSRGLLVPEEQAQARAEAGRRLLASAEQAPTAVHAGGKRLALVAAAAAPLLAAGLYLAIGSPGMADSPMAGRIAQWRQANPATLTPPQIAAVLTEVAKDKPNDPELLRMLAAARMQANDPFGAANALRRAVSLRPNDAALLSALGEAFVAVSGGEIADDARRAFTEANRLDPTALSPRYHLSKAALDDGRKAEGLAGLKGVLADLSPEDPNRAGLADEIARLEGGGQEEDMSGAIRGMVDGLAARLEAEPNDPEGWARLVRALSVLGETARRDAALARARALFKDRPDVLRTLETASERPQ
jgi:cytochrome c-type biogenesis protein CcmH